jgi:hypothetical protein
VRNRLALALLAVAAASGCGDGGDDDKAADPAAQPPSASAQGKAVADWAAKARAYSNDFQNCGVSVTPTRRYFETCTKDTRRSLQTAEKRVLREVRRSKTAACTRPRARLEKVMANVETALSNSVRSYDRLNDAALEHRNYSGPPPNTLYLSAAQALEDDVPEARRLSRTIDAGC